MNSNGVEMKFWSKKIIDDQVASLSLYIGLTKSNVSYLVPKQKEFQKEIRIAQTSTAETEYRGHSFYLFPLKVQQRAQEHYWIEQIHSYVVFQHSHHH